MAARPALALLAKPLLSAGRAYNAHAQRRPFAVGTVTTVVKTSAADLFAQTVMEGRDWSEIDWRRHGLFCSFGLVYLGCFQYYLYNNLFVRMCHAITSSWGHRASAPIKVLIDQGIHHPFVYFPAFYLLKGAVEGRPLGSTWAKYESELWENLKALWMIWVPAQTVNFTLVPRHLRIPYVAGVSFVWTVILSVMRGALGSAAAAAPTTQQLAEAVEAAAAAAAAAASPAGATAFAEAPAAAVMAGGGGGSGDVSSQQQQQQQQANISSSSSVLAARVGVGSPAGLGGGGLKALVASPREG